MIKKTLQLILLLSITFSCASRKNKSSKTTKNAVETNIQIPINKSDYSPGTFGLDIKITEITKHEDRYQVKAIVNKSLGTGSGITHIFAEAENISFILTSNLELVINNNYQFLFKEIQTMNTNKPKLLFIKKIN